jgi:predicted nucleic acid-binding protein
MLYFDTSFLVPLLLEEATSEKIERFLLELSGRELATSHWARVEFSSLLAREVRIGGLNARSAREVATEFDTLMKDSFTLLLPTVEDFDRAQEYLGHHHAGLRAGDALHLAIARNHHCEAVHTLDKTMLKAGRQLGLSVSAGISLPR